MTKDVRKGVPCADHMYFVYEYCDYLPDDMPELLYLRVFPTKRAFLEYFLELLTTPADPGKLAKDRDYGYAIEHYDRNNNGSDVAAVEELLARDDLESIDICGRLCEGSDFDICCASRYPECVGRFIKIAKERIDIDFRGRDKRVEALSESDLWDEEIMSGFYSATLFEHYLDRLSKDEELTEREFDIFFRAMMEFYAV